MAIQFDNNLLPSTGAELLYTLRARLLTAGWTCVKSGDGLSAYSSSSGTAITSYASGSSGSSVEELADGLRFSLVRSGGWRASPRVRVTVVDSGGNIPVR